MGVIQRQGLKNLVINLSSMALGVVNVLYIYPLYIAFYGLTQMASNILRLLSPFSLWGILAVINKYHIDYDERNKGHLVSFVIKWFGISFTFFTIFYFFILPIFYSSLDHIFPYLKILDTHAIGIYFLIFFYSIILILTNLSYVNKRIVVPNLVFKLISTKVLIPALILFVGVNHLTQSYIIWGLVLIYFLSSVVLLVYSSKNRWLSVEQKDLIINNNIRERLNYGTYGILNDTGLYFAFSIDVIMVYFLLGDASTGIYAIFLFLSYVVRLPMDSISGLILPMVSSMIKKNDWGAINRYFKSISTAMFVLSSFLFMAIFVSMDDLLVIMNKTDLVVAKYIFVFLSAGILINGLTYMNGSIIVQSKHYKWNLFFISLLAISNTALTYYFIVYLFPDSIKTAGAACATAVSLILFNVFKTIFVYIKWGLNPFSWRTVGAILLCVFLSLGLSQIDFGNNPYINIFINSVIVFCLYGLPLYYLEVSEELTKIVNDTVLNWRNLIGMKN